MGFWLREANLTIGKKKYSASSFNFSFEVPFEATEELPVATITLTNLSAETRAGIKKDQKVILNAGYEGDVGCILVGNVVGLKHKQSATDWTTTVTVQPNADKVLKQRVNKTYKKNSKASVIVKDLLNIFGVEVGKFELEKDKTYSRGRVCKGKLINVLKEIVVNECGSRLITFPTGQLYIVKKKDSGKVVKLNDGSGLLRSDEEKVVFEVEKKQETGASGNDSEKYTPRSCLLNHRIGPNTLVSIQSDSLNGKFTVMKGSHKGNRSNSWVTTMELRLDSSAPQKAAIDTAKAKASSKTGTRKNVKFGDRGNAVKELQKALNEKGANIAVDGIFGQETRAAVIDFQKGHDLKPGGTVDSATWNEVL